MKGRLIGWLAANPSSNSRQAGFAAARMLSNAAGLVITYGVTGLTDGIVPSRMSLAAKIAIAFVLQPVVIRMDDVVRKLAGLPDGASARRARRVELLITILAALAALLAGHRHAHLREAWTADLYGDPESADRPPARRRLRLAAGFVAASLRFRLDDAAVLAWRPVDALLASWHGSNLAALMPVTIAAGLVLSREGFYRLISDADSLGVIATAPYLAVRFLRKYRQIPAPKRPEKKAQPADGPGR